MRPIDSDFDGVNDALDDFPFDVSETLDSDGDGIGNTADPDDDNDDVDNDDAFPLTQLKVYTDGDGVGNNRDTDDDGDGILDVLDGNPLIADNVDSDGDGVLDTVGYPTTQPTTSTLITTGSLILRCLPE